MRNGIQSLLIVLVSAGTFKCFDSRLGGLLKPATASHYTSSEFDTSSHSELIIPTIDSKLKTALMLTS